MSTEMRIREHFDLLAEEVTLSPTGSEAVVKRVRRNRVMWGLAIAAMVVVAVGVTTTVLPRQDATAPAASDGAVLDRSWKHIVVSPDGGAVVQVVGTPSGGFVLLTENQRWFTSESGEAWVEHDPVGLGMDSRIQMVANAGDRLVAAGSSIEGSPLVATSLDGIVWESALPGDAGDWIPVSIAVADDTVVVPFVNSSFESVVYRFTVADLWVVAAVPEPGNQVLMIGVIGERFIAQVMDAPEGSKHRDYVSDDGLDWKPGVPIPPVQVNKALTSPIVEGPGGAYLVSPSTGGGEQLMRSSDGDVWEPAIDAAFEFGPPSLVTGEYGIVAALPTNSDAGSGAIVTILYSPDGELWATEDLGTEFSRSSRLVVLGSDQRRIVVGGGVFESRAPRGGARTEVWVADR